MYMEAKRNFINIMLADNTNGILIKLHIWYYQISKFDNIKKYYR